MPFQPAFILIKMKIIGKQLQDTSGLYGYGSFDIFQKVVFSLALYTEEVNLQTFVMI